MMKPVQRSCLDALPRGGKWHSIITMAAIGTNTHTYVTMRRFEGEIKLFKSTHLVQNLFLAVNIFLLCYISTHSSPSTTTMTCPSCPPCVLVDHNALADNIIARHQDVGVQLTRSTPNPPSPTRSPEPTQLTSSVVGSHTLLSQRPRTGLLLVILSASRPNGVDHVTDLTRLFALSGVTDSIAVYDADPVSIRSFPWANTVIRGPQDHINELVAKAEREAGNDKYRDPVTRIKWRSKNALDFAYALEYAYNQRESYPYTLMLEDDVWPAVDFESRIRELLSWDEKTLGSWWAWTLFHCKSFDKRPSYRHGDPYEFQACTQAMLYHSDSLKPFVAYAKGNYREEPFDWIVRNYQYDIRSRINVVIPSLVQHIGGGAGSTLETKVKESKTDGCHAFDYTQPANIVAQQAEMVPTSRPTVAQMPANGIEPDATRSRRKY